MLPDAVITDTDVYFDGWRLPWYIASDGIRITPGGSNDINSVSIEFLVETVVVKDSWDLDWATLKCDSNFWFESEMVKIDKLIEEYC